MGGTKDGDDDHRRAVAVVDGSLRDSGWQQLDLDGVLDALPRAPGSISTVLSASASGIVRSFPETGAELATILKRAPARVVPPSAFVSIGRRGTSPVPRHRARMSLASRSANDNDAVSGGRSIWRDVFFLALLFATVLGAFWSGRVHGLQKVIVVPGPSSFYSVVT